MEDILNIFEQFMMPRTAIDQYDTVGRAILADKISPFVAANNPIEFSMLGFPFKSINDRDKVLGKVPDLGELLSFENFKLFGEQMKTVYQPGVKIHIVSDGLAFNQLMNVSEYTVDEYGDICKDYSSAAPIVWHNLRSFYGNKRADFAREKMFEQFGITEAELERRILTDPDVNFLYKAMIRFMEGDLAILHYDARNQLHKAAKKMAREMMLANEAFSAMVRANLSDKIRISMHQSVNNGNKFSFSLICGAGIRHSAWHSAILVKKDGSLETKHRKDAELAGNVLVYEDGRPYYFTEEN